MKWVGPGSSKEDAISFVRERRGASRVQVELPVTVKFNSSGQYEFKAVSRDISASGVYLYFDQNVQVGERVSMELSIPYGSSAPVPMKICGTVIRIDKSTLAGMAVAFDNLIIEPGPPE